jgi:hypothetical protein
MNAISAGRGVVSGHILSGAVLMAVGMDATSSTITFLKPTGKRPAEIAFIKY